MINGRCEDSPKNEGEEKNAITVQAGACQGGGPRIPGGGWPMPGGRIPGGIPAPGKPGGGPRIIPGGSEPGAITPGGVRRLRGQVPAVRSGRPCPAAGPFLARTLAFHDPQRGPCPCRAAFQESEPEEWRPGKMTKLYEKVDVSIRSSSQSINQSNRQATKSINQSINQVTNSNRYWRSIYIAMGNASWLIDCLTKNRHNSGSFWVF